MTAKVEQTIILQRRKLVFLPVKAGKLHGRFCTSLKANTTSQLRQGWQKKFDEDHECKIK